MKVIYTKRLKAGIAQLVERNLAKTTISVRCECNQTA
jgi:hypothetical protein